MEIANNLEIEIESVSKKMNKMNKQLTKLNKQLANQKIAPVVENLIAKVIADQKLIIVLSPKQNSIIIEDLQRREINENKWKLYDGEDLFYNFSVSRIYNRYSPMKWEFWSNGRVSIDDEPLSKHIKTEIYFDPKHIILDDEDINAADREKGEMYENGEASEAVFCLGSSQAIDHMIDADAETCTECNDILWMSESDTCNTCEERYCLKCISIHKDN